MYILSCVLDHTTFFPLFHSLCKNMALIGKAVSERKIFNQRTNGLVNAHVRSGIYTNGCIDEYSKLEGTDESLGSILFS